MSFHNKITDIDLITLSNKNYLSFISKRNKIHEEIKDYVIDRFIKQIYEQNKEILQLKKKLEETIKNSLLIIKRFFLKKKFFPVNQITLSYLNNNNKNEKLNNFTFDAGNAQNIHVYKTNKKSHTINANCLYTITKINLKKYLKPKPSLNQNNTINSNKSKNLFQYNESLDEPLTYRNISRNNISKDSTIISNKKFDTFFVENNNNNNKIESFNDNIIKKSNINSLYDKNKQKNLTLHHSKNNTLCNHNSFFEEKFVKINNFRINNNKEKNKIKATFNGFCNNSNSKRYKSKNIKCFKKLNLTNIIFNNNHNQNNKILHYCQTDRTIKKGEKIKSIYIDYKNIPLSAKNNKITNENYININNHSLPNYKKAQFNKISFKMKEINKLYMPDIQNYSQKTERPSKKLNMNDIHNVNITNYISMTDRFLSNNKFNEYNLKTNKDIKKKNIKTTLQKSNKKYYINVNEIDNNNNNEKSFKTLYNPTFTSFLNRTMNLNNGKNVKKIHYVMNNIE